MSTCCACSSPPAPPAAPPSEGDSTILISIVATVGGLTVVAFFVCLLYCLVRVHERHAVETHRLRWLSTGLAVAAPPLDADNQYHLLLSHAWKAGQHQMRVIKIQLNALIPNLKIFLDVDDLSFGKGAVAVMQSTHVLIFVTKHFFQSHACMMELLIAVIENKRIVLLSDDISNLHLGETTDGRPVDFHAWLLEQLRGALGHYAKAEAGDSSLKEWNAAEIFSHQSGRERHLSGVGWSAISQKRAADLPKAEDVMRAMTASGSLLEWTVQPVFQNVVLQHICYRIVPIKREAIGRRFTQRFESRSDSSRLTRSTGWSPKVSGRSSRKSRSPCSTGVSQNGPAEVYVQDTRLNKLLKSRPPAKGYKYHLYLPESNEGAQQLVQELEGRTGIQLQVLRLD